MKWVALCAAVLALVGADRYHEGRSGGALREGGGPRSEQSAAHWVNEAQAGLAERLALPLRRGKARNVVMFLGDGMSVPTLAAARTLLGQRRGDTGEEAHLSFEKFPTTGLAKTYCVNQQIPDSACTATAYLCGVKNNYGTIGVTAAVPRHNCDASVDPATHVQSIAEWALADGRDAGIVTTTRITHASPAGTYAKVANRNWENDAEVVASNADTERCPDIAHQLVHSHPGDKFKVIFGGGRRNFIPNTAADEEGTSGRRRDGRNLIEEWQDDKDSRNVSYNYVWHREQLMALREDPPEYLLGLFEGNHLRYNMQTDSVSEPTLAELTEIAIRSLSRNENGFFLFVEGGRIDHAHHDNYVGMALDETIQFSEAVTRATEMLSEEDSLIVVTSDHAHVMTFNGYSQRGHDILGPSDQLDDHGVPYMTLSYANGPGFRSHVEGIRPNVLLENSYRQPQWRSHVDAWLDSETHGGDDVAVFARGPYHDLFTGLYEQSQIPHRMAYAACIGPGLHACDSAASDAPESESAASEAPESESAASDAPESESAASEAPESESAASEAPESESAASEAPESESADSDAHECESAASAAHECDSAASVMHASIALLTAAAIALVALRF